MMKSSIKLAPMAMLLLAAMLWLPLPAQAEPPHVVATITPIYALTAPVMEGAGEPEMLMRPGDNPHHFSMTPQHAKKLLAADLIICTGKEMEYYLKPLLSAMPERKFSVVEAINTPGMTVLSAREPQTIADKDTPQTQIDMHFWLNPVNAMAYTTHIASELARLDPENAGLYAANASRQVSRLKALDDEIRKALNPTEAPIEARYASYHPSLAYFEQHYGIRGGKAVTRTPEAGASVDEAARLYADIEAGKLHCLFQEPEFSPALLQQAAARHDGKTRVMTLDVLGATYEADNAIYFNMMRDIAAHIAECVTPATVP